MAINLKGDMYTVQSSLNKMTDILSGRNEWYDEVSKSYERYADYVRNSVSSMDFVITRIEGAIDYVKSINVNKHEADLKSYEAKLRSI